MRARGRRVCDLRIEQAYLLLAIDAESKQHISASFAKRVVAGEHKRWFPRRSQGRRH